MLEVVREVGHGAAAVHLFAGGAVGFGHGSRAAAEHADFADLQSEEERKKERSESERGREGILGGKRQSGLETTSLRM